VRFELAPRTLLVVLAAIAACWLLFKLWTIGIVVMVALMLVGTLSPLIAALERRRIRRPYALIGVFVSLLLALSVLLLLTIPPLIDQLLTLLADAPAKRAELIAWLHDRPLLAPLAAPLRDAGLDALTEAAGSHLLGYSSEVVTMLGYAITTVFLGFYLLADGKRAKGTLFALVPREFHVRLARILINLESIVGGYVRGQLITSAAMFAFAFVLLRICHVPNALSLSVFAALVDVIPFIGGLLATAPAVAMAASRGSTVAIAVLIAMIAYQEFESRLLVPRVYGRVLRLSPAAVMLALLIGGTLLGIVGALLALPIAAGMRMVARELRVEMPGDDSSDSPERARDARAERNYDRRSAGAEPVRAAAIASAVAHESQAADAAAKAP